jgi:Flp pilus assembly protein CpaB
MKSKNVVLMAVAVGCGLVAAYVTARLSAKGSDESVTVLVAGEQLEQGTVIKLDDKGESKQLAWKTFPKGSEPGTFINDPKALNGKRLNKTLRKADHFTEGDLTTNQGIALPKGRTGKALKVAPESCAGGLVLPGSRVHVVLSEATPNGTKRSAIIMKEMLVVAVNTDTDRPEGTNAIKQPTTITLAVTPKQGAQLSLAEKRGDLSLLLCDNLTKAQAAAADEVKQEDISFEPITELPCDRKSEFAKSDGTPDAAATTAPKTQLWVAKADLPAGTKLDDLAAYLEKVPADKVPENAVNEDAQLKGQTLTKPVYKNSFVPKAALEGRTDVETVVATPKEKGPAANLRTLEITNGQFTQRWLIDMDAGRILPPAGN